MEEQVRFSANGGGRGDDGVSEWEDGLPSVDDLTPLSQSLIPSELASAFSISPETHRSMIDVNRASRNTFDSILSQSQSLKNFNFKEFDKNFEFSNEFGEDPNGTGSDPDGNGEDPRKIRRVEAADEEFESDMRTETENESSMKTSKRQRLVWTPQLHKRFVDVVAHLGVKNAVPKTIMQMMNVEGLTRENVASHLQKYRLYLKRMQSNEDPSGSDHLFDSTPVPQSLQHESRTNGTRTNGTMTNGNNGSGNYEMHGQMAAAAMQMPYPPQMVPMMVPMPHGFDSYNYMVHQQQRDWSYRGSNDK